MSDAPQALFNVEIEVACLAILLQYPDTWGDFNLITESDWSKTNKPLFGVIRMQLDTTPPGSVSSVVLAEKLKAHSITSMGEQGDVSVYDYLEALRIRFVERKDSVHMARELKRVSVRRELVFKAEMVAKQLRGSPQASFQEMTSIVEKGLSSVTTDYYQRDEFTNVFDTIVEVTEKRADNPVDAATMGYMGPFDTINKLLGAICDKGLMVTVGARTGNQKSALGFYYNFCLAEKYKVPILLLDVGEMSLERIQRRAVCVLAEGKVPLWAIASGQWRQNKEWKRVIQEECWPRVKGVRFDYINVGNMDHREKISLIRRYYYNKVGRGNTLGILDDYLKGTEAFGRNTAEYQSIGYYINDVKSMITTEIPAWYWTSVQNNRTGVYQGKKAADIVDSEDQMGLSDRIIQQSDWGFILRWKVTEEIAAEGQLFGNMRLTPVKTREALGKEYEKALRPVKLPSGRFQTNYFSLESKSFAFSECGDLHKILQTLGRAPLDMKTETGAPKKEGL